MRTKNKRAVAAISIRHCHFQIKVTLLMPDLLFDSRLDVIIEMEPQTVRMRPIIHLELQFAKVKLYKVAACQKITRQSQYVHVGRSLQVCTLRGVGWNCLNVNKCF